MGEWIKCSERLPELGIYVLARYNGGNWRDNKDQENVDTVIVKMRADTPQHNNKKDYSWTTFGPSNFFGQEMDYWMPLPKPPGAP